MFKYILLLSLGVCWTFGNLGEGQELSNLINNKDQNSQCQEKCKETYTKDSSIESCNRGCRLAAITDALTFTQNEDLNQTIDTCESSCGSSYESTAEDTKSCQRGCSYMVPSLQKRRKELKSPLDDFFGNGLFHSIRIPRIFISGTPVIMRISDESDDDNEQKVIENDVDDESEEVNPFLRTTTQTLDDDDDESFNPFGDFFGNSNNNLGNIFSRVNSMMKNTFEKFHENLPEMMKGGTGKMVVIKNGPNGFHEKKTYNLGPNGEKWELTDESVTTTLDDGYMNDMMDKENPLDNFITTDKEPEFIGDRGIPIVDKYYPLGEYDEPEPKLPESGLKTRYMFENVCNQDSSNMKWSDWVSCLHVQIGVPRWLTAATLSLGIVFSLWLCLAIPQNAPKQKIIMKSTLSKAAIAKAKEAEANSTLISVVSNSMNDKPPAYEDIGTNLKVNLAPVHSTTEEKKVPLPDDEEPKESKA